MYNNEDTNDNGLDSDTIVYKLVAGAAVLLAAIVAMAGSI